MRFLTAIILLLCASSAGLAAGFDPNNPAASGYSLVFDDEFKTVATIDINNTQLPGFNWYVQYPFGAEVTPPTDINVTNGVLTLSPQPGDGSANGWLATAVRVEPTASNPEGYNGCSFGGGFYVEAEISFDPTNVGEGVGYPAFWAESLEHIINAGQQWPGQAAGYSHFVEDDIFEYDTYSGWGANTFGGTVIDWYGIYNVTCSGYCKVWNFPLAPLGTFQNAIVYLDPSIVWTQFHRIGQLYTPGTLSNGYAGSLQWYFDGVSIPDFVTWVDNGASYQAGLISPPPTGNFAFSIIDQQSLVLSLKAGTTSPLKVKYVRVWQ